MRGTGCEVRGTRYEVRGTWYEVWGRWYEVHLLGILNYVRDKGWNREIGTRLKVQEEINEVRSALLKTVSPKGVLKLFFLLRNCNSPPTIFVNNA